jgi:hypothetical protein
MISRRRLCLVTSRCVLIPSRRKCCPAPRFLMPLFHSGRVRLPFLYVRPSGVSHTTLSWVCRFSGFRHLTAGCWSRFAILLLFPLWDALLRPPVPLRRHFIPGPTRTCPLRIAGTAQQVNRLRAAANLCRGPPLPWARLFGLLWCLMARRWSPYRSSVIPIVSWSVAPSGTPWGSSTTSVFWSWFLPLHQTGVRHSFTASVASRQAFISPS